MKNIVIYQGNKFCVEWYFDKRGKQPGREYFLNLSEERQKKVMGIIRLLADMGKIFNQEKFRYEGDQIFALKPSPDRFLCFFFQGAKIIVTNAYEKKTAKMPVGEKLRALKAKDDYIKRCGEGDYYD